MSFLGNQNATRDNLNVLNDYKSGGGFAGIVGYDFGQFRVEGEIGKHYNSLDQLVVSNDATLGLASGSATAGNSNVSHFMLNAVLDFDEFRNDLKIEPFIGAGLGLSSVKLINLTVPGAPAFVNNADDVFSYQAFAGLRAPLSEHVDLSLKYRYMASSNSQMIDRLGEAFNYNHDVHDVVVGITYNFGVQAIRQASPPSPLPEPAPVADTLPAVAVEPPAPLIDRGPYVIYFDWDSSMISPAGREIIRKAINESTKMERIIIQVDGHADRSGPNGYNDNLSFERAQAVRQAMIASGVIHRDRILIEGYGERMPDVMTADGIRERLNRRVTIKLN